MTNELTAVNGAGDKHEKVEQEHVDAEEENDEVEEDGAPEGTGAGGTRALVRTSHCGLYRARG